MFVGPPLCPSDLGIILSYKCQAACAHCLYNCGPQWTDWMSYENVERALQATLIWDQPFQVHITGGEPFLNFPLLLHAVRTAKALDIPCYVETNAGWCIHQNLISDRFEGLKSAGLDAILISCSPFHAESIPPRRTLKAIDIALEVFGSQGVMVYLPDWIDHVTRFDLDMPTPLDRYIEAFGQHATGVLLWEGYRLISGGRSGYRLGHLIPRQPASTFAGENCFIDILHAHHSHFDLYGNFISGFCGGLAIGDWRSLPEILEKARAGQFPELFATLISSGPHGLYEYAREKHGYQPLTDGYTGKCHLCVDVRRHLVNAGDHPELRPRAFYERI